MSEMVQRRRYSGATRTNVVRATFARDPWSRSCWHATPTN